MPVKQVAGPAPRRRRREITELQADDGVCAHFGRNSLDPCLASRLVGFRDDGEQLVYYLVRHREFAIVETDARRVSPWSFGPLEHVQECASAGPASATLRRESAPPCVAPAMPDD
jgi:hypothetical protein